MVQASSMPTVDRSTYEILKAKTLQPTWFAPQDSDDFFFPKTSMSYCKNRISVCGLLALWCPDCGCLDLPFFAEIGRGRDGHGASEFEFWLL